MDLYHLKNKSSDSGNVIINVMVLYTAKVAAVTGRNMASYIKLLEDSTNLAYEKSNANLRIKVVHSQEVSADQGDEFADADLHHDRAQQPSERDPVHEGRCLRLFRETTQGGGSRDFAPGGATSGRALERGVQTSLHRCKSGSQQRGLVKRIRWYG